MESGVAGPVIGAGPAATRPGRSSVRWNILALLFGASFVAYILRTNLSVAGESMMGDLGLSHFQLGVVLAAFAWGYAIFQLPGGVFGDLIGSRRALTILAFGWGMLNLLVGFVPAATHSLASPAVILTTLIVLRFLMGAAQAPLYPVTGGGTICNWFPLSGWAFPNGLTNAGLTLGSAATGPLIAWLTITAGWRRSFILTAPLGFLLAGVWWWYVRDRPAEHPAVSRRELELIDAGREAGATRERHRSDWRRVLGHRDVLLLTASYFCSNYVFYFFFNWLFIYLVEGRGFKLLEGGYFAAAPWIAGAVGAVLGGVVCDRLSRRVGIRWGCRLPCVVGLVLTALFIVASASATSPYFAVGCLSLCLASQQATEGPFWAAAISASGRHAAVGCGVMNTGGNVVGGVGALLIPVIVRQFGWGAAVASGAIFAIVAAGLWLWIRVDEVAGRPG